MSDLVGRWHDEKGTVFVDLASDERVFYVRNGKGFMLGIRRFLRDFKRGAADKGPMLSVQADNHLNRKEQ